MTVLAFLRYFVYIIAFFFFFKDFQELSRSMFALLPGPCQGVIYCMGEASISTNSLLCKLMLYTTLIQHHQDLVISPGSYWYVSFRPWNSFSTFFLFSLNKPRTFLGGLCCDMTLTIGLLAREGSEGASWGGACCLSRQRLCILCKEGWDTSL